MKLNLKDTLILSAGIGSLIGLSYFLLNGWWLDAYFPGMLMLGFFMWFLYRKGKDYKQANK